MRKVQSSRHKGVVDQLQPHDQIAYLKDNPKIEGSSAHQRYQRYRSARTVAEAVRKGALPMDLRYDYDKGYLRIVDFQLEVAEWDIEALDPRWEPLGLDILLQRVPGLLDIAFPDSQPKFVRVLVKELQPSNVGVDLRWEGLAKLVARIPGLAKVQREQWATEAGPFATVPFGLVRVLLNWAATGWLRFPRNSAEVLSSVFRTWSRDDLADLALVSATNFTQPRPSRNRATSCRGVQSIGKSISVSRRSKRRTPDKFNFARTAQWLAQTRQPFSRSQGKRKR